MIDGIKLFGTRATLPTDEKKQTIKGLHFYKDSFGSYAINGSIHKYYNDGKQNADDFYYTNLVEAVYKFCKEFDIEPIASRVSRVEAGVNLPIDNVDEVLDSIILYKNQIGNFDSIGRRFVYADYDLKLYRKTSKILRVEVKAKSKRFLKNNNIYVTTLDDLLLESVLNALRQLLIKTFEGVTIIHLPDNKVSQLNAKDVLIYKDYSNPIYWNRLNRTNKKKFQRERAKCRKFIKSVGGIDLKEVLLEKIESKSFELLNFNELDMSKIIDKSNENKKGEMGKMSYIDNSRTKWTLSIPLKDDNSTINIPLIYNLDEIIKESRRAVLFLNVA